MAPIETRRDFFRMLREGPFTSLGSYPLFFVTRGGSALSHSYVRENAAELGRALGPRGGSAEYLVVGVEVNWEDPELYCDATSERIPSAYAEPEETP